MKKNILIAIVLCVFNSVAAFAQTEKEYSMIICLQNGSTVTLGHNDIKNITFTGDKINAEGNVVTTIEELKNMITENYVLFRFSSVRTWVALLASSKLRRLSSCMPSFASWSLLRRLKRNTV